MNHPIRSVLMVLLCATAAACRPGKAPPVPAANQSADPGGVSASDQPSSLTERAADLPTTPVVQLNVPKASLAALAEPVFRRMRLDMVERQIASSYGDGRTAVRDKRVLEAMRWVPRHEFVPSAIRRWAYWDSPLEIGHNQTISQPYIVALMTEMLQPQPHQRVLEIGTGSGYQAAVLALLAKEVYTIEIVEPLAKRAEKDLQRLGYNNVYVRYGDGYRGWPDKAPFDAIIVTAAPERIPQPLIDQLTTGGRMVLPVGPRFNQELVVLHKTARGIVRETGIPVLFVPMVGEIQKRED